MLRVPLVQKKFCRKVTFSLMLFFAGTFLIPGTFAADAVDSEAASFIKAYNEEDNNILKRNMLRDMAKKTRETGEAVAQWKKDLLLDGLQQKDPTVVESAVQQIGALKLAEFNRRLITLYQKSGDLFGNMYDSRVRISIVTALSRTGRNDITVFNLFREILDHEKTEFAYVQGDVLQSITMLNDPKYIPMVKKYGQYMENAIAQKRAAGEHAMLYQILVDYSSMCDDIVRTLKK